MGDANHVRARRRRDLPAQAGDAGQSPVVPEGQGFLAVEGDKNANGKDRVSWRMVIL